MTRHRPFIAMQGDAMSRYWSQLTRSGFLGGVREIVQILKQGILQRRFRVGCSKRQTLGYRRNSGQLRNATPCNEKKCDPIRSSVVIQDRHVVTGRVGDVQPSGRRDFRGKRVVLFGNVLGNRFRQQGQ